MLFVHEHTCVHVVEVGEGGGVGRVHRVVPGFSPAAEVERGVGGADSKNSLSRKRKLGDDLAVTSYSRCEALFYIYYFLIFF